MATKLILTALFAAVSLAESPYFLGDKPDFQYGTYEFQLPLGINPPPAPVVATNRSRHYERVVFLSFDGMHQFDLRRIVTQNSSSNFAKLLQNGVAYSNARTSAPSDSLPATASIFTGAAPRTHGVFWEQSFDRSLYTGGTGCTGPIGGVCDYSEACDLNNTLLDGGGGFNLTYLPQQKTAWGTCEPVLPHNFLYVNTIFEVARANGLYTAYADKHLSYEFVNGPSGTGLSEGYFPEIAAVGNTLKAQEAWDDLHWAAVGNWSLGNFLNGTANPVGGPAIFGANFQAITWAQADAGYLNASGVPNATLAAAFQFSDQRLGEYLSLLDNAGKLESTLVIVGSKQGQGPVNSKILDLLNPNLVMNHAGVPVAYFNGEDGGIMYLKNPSDAPTAKANLLAKKELGISWILAGDEVQAAGFGCPTLDPRVPDLIIGVKTGILWNDGFEFEDHGGFAAQDLNVPLIAYNPRLKAQNMTQIVSTRSIASTMLKALGLPTSELQAFALGQAPILPGIFRD